MQLQLNINCLKLLQNNKQNDVSESLQPKLMQFESLNRDNLNELRIKQSALGSIFVSQEAGSVSSFSSEQSHDSI